MYYSPTTNKNCAKKLIPVPPLPNGVYYWTDPIPSYLKTRHELILLYLQPRRQAAPKGVKRTVLDHKWRFGGSTEVVSQDLLDQYRDEVCHGTLTDAEFRYLESRGYGVESKLYDLADTEPLAPTETNGRDFFSYLSFDGSHPDQYINEANAQRENRRTYKSHVSRPNFLDHLRGINILGPVKDKNGIIGLYCGILTGTAISTRGSSWPMSWRYMPSWSRTCRIAPLSPRSIRRTAPR